MGCSDLAFVLCFELCPLFLQDIYLIIFVVHLQIYIQILCQLELTPHGTAVLWNIWGIHVEFIMTHCMENP